MDAATYGALGPVMRTKAIRFYVAVALMVPLTLLRSRRRRATPALGGMGVGVSGYAVTARWLARDAPTVGTLSSEDCEAQVLAMRAGIASRSLRACSTSTPLAAWNATYMYYVAYPETDTSEETTLQTMQIVYQPAQ